MKVVHLAYTYGIGRGGGAAIAASRLHEALLAVGVESHFVCLIKHGEGRNVHVLPKGKFVSWFYYLVAKVLRGGWRLTPFRKRLSTNLIPLPGLRRMLDEIKPDVLHVHWINYGVTSQESLTALPYPIVQNLHDLWPIDALNFYPGSDRRFITGMNRQNSNWMERWMLERKRRFSQRKNISFIGPSNWVVEMCRVSIVGQGLSAYAIPNVIDSVFSYDPSLPAHHERFRFLFGCAEGIHNEYKGFSDVAAALAYLPENIKNKMVIQVFGHRSSLPNEIEGVPMENLGLITDPSKMREIYHAADVFLFPSRQETQGMTKIEAMLCGLPVLAFYRTACAEGIVPNQTGWIIKDGDIKSFANAMAEAVMKGVAYFCSQKYTIADLAQKRYNNSQIVKDVLKVYSDTVAKCS